MYISVHSLERRLTSYLMFIHVLTKHKTEDISKVYLSAYQTEDLGTYPKYISLLPNRRLVAYPNGSLHSLNRRVRINPMYIPVLTKQKTKGISKRSLTPQQAVLVDVLGCSIDEASSHPGCC